MNRQSIPTVEWLTVTLLCINYVVFVLLCVFYNSLPWWVVAAGGGLVVCLHGSLQHEVIHGHPTRSRRLNEWLVFPAIGIWLPYGIYRDTHLKHHIDEYITDPFEDPESYFVDTVTWRRAGRCYRWVLMIRNTVFGRLLFGPVWAVITLVKTEVSALAKGDHSHLHYWGWHLLSVIMIFFWLNALNIPLHEYVLLFALPGLSLTLLRSFLEHRADHEPARRTVVVKSGGLMSLLFLNNNLHALHHEQPALPWYRLPGEFNRQSAEVLERNGGYFYTGYIEIIRRYFFSPKTHPRHPYR